MVEERTLPLCEQCGESIAADPDETYEGARAVLDRLEADLGIKASLEIRIRCPECEAINNRGTPQTGQT